MVVRSSDPIKMLVNVVRHAKKNRPYEPPGELSQPIRSEDESDWKEYDEEDEEGQNSSSDDDDDDEKEVGQSSSDDENSGDTQKNRRKGKKEEVEDAPPALNINMYLWPHARVSTFFLCLFSYICSSLLSFRMFSFAVF
jgi:hypothetical protein